MPGLKLRKGKSSAEQVRTTSDLIKMVDYAGWTNRCSGGQMYVIYPPDGESISINCGSPTGDWRVVHNAKARLRRAGLFEAVDTKFAEQTGAAKLRAEEDREKTEHLIETLNETQPPAAEGDTMAKRSLLELVSRCEKVGWQARAIGADKSHYLIHPAGNKRPITIHVASTVRAYPETVLAQLSRAGLIEAEEAMGLTKNRHDETPDDTHQENTDSADATPAFPLSTAASGVGEVPSGVTHVDGVEVAEWAWSKTPFQQEDRKAVELLLEDGSVVYSCIKGDFIGKTYASVARIHRARAHPEILSATAQRRISGRLAAAQLAAEPEDNDLDDEQSGPGPVISLLRPPAGPMPLFVAAGNAHVPSQAARLAQLLGSDGVAANAMAAVTAPAGAPPAASAVPDEDASPASFSDEQIRRFTDETPPSAPVSPAPARAAAPQAAAPQAQLPLDAASQEPVTARVHQTPPVARVQIAAMAGKSRPTAATPPARDVPLQAPNLAAAAGLPVSGHPQIPLTEMVARLQKLSQGGAAAAELREQNEALSEQVNELKAKLDSAVKQGAALAEQCIAKDATIRQLRADAEAAQATVDAAQQMQALLSSLLGGAEQAA